jgi:DNA-binding MarR family transcriptional regulator
VSTNSNLRRALRLVEEFRNLDGNIPGQAIHCFLEIATQPGIAVKDLAVRTNMAASSASRNVMLLSDTHRSGKPGLGLIEVRQNPNDWRRKSVYLTPEGERLVQSVVAIVEGSGSG